MQVPLYQAGISDLPRVGRRGNVREFHFPHQDLRDLTGLHGVPGMRVVRGGVRIGIDLHRRPGKMAFFWERLNFHN